MKPFVSVIIPVRNEEQYVERCLYSIARQDYPRDRLEVLVADGRSDDGTRAIVSRFAAESTLDLRLLDNPARRTAAALNLALGEARGEIIVRVDGHAALGPDYLRRAIEALQASGADCAGGVLDNEGDTPSGRAIAAAMSSFFGVGGARFRTGGGGPVDTVAFGAYPRRVFDTLGQFREDIEAGEDDEFNYRLRDAGGVILLVPEMRATYTVRGSLRSLWRQYFAYGRAKVQVLRLHPRQVQARQLAPSAFVAALVGSGVLAAFGRSRPFKALLTVYASAAAIASAGAAARRGYQVLPLLPVVFACMHVAYGAGTLAGWAEMARRLLGGGHASDGMGTGSEASRFAD